MITSPETLPDNNNKTPATTTTTTTTPTTDAGSSASSYHSFMVNGAEFSVDAKYKPLKALGHGAYGVVCSALNTDTNEYVAIKKVNKAFEDRIDAKRMLRESKLLRHFEHENLVALCDIIPPCQHPYPRSLDDVYFVMELMETDLHKIIYSSNELSDDHIQYFLYQILRGLQYIHSANVIHRDLKPSNLLLNSSCDLKLCDFGLARGVNSEEDYELTEYVVTRHYRAPEIMCCNQQYDYKIDVWSAGCILAELHGREPLFPGEDYLEQMNLIFNVIGTPSEKDMKIISNDKAVEYIQSLPKTAAKSFAEIYKNATPEACDLMERMLKFDPEERISVEDALNHPYLKAFQPIPTSLCPKPFAFEFEHAHTSKDELRDLMWQEILEFRRGSVPEQRPVTPPSTPSLTPITTTTTTDLQNDTKLGQKRPPSSSSSSSCSTTTAMTTVPKPQQHPEGEEEVFAEHYDDEEVDDDLLPQHHVKRQKSED